MKKSEVKGNQMFLVILAIVVLIVAVVGASYAYFNAATTSGNVTNKISTATAKYGSMTVTYPGTDGTITMGTVDLAYSTRSSKPVVQGLLKFTVASSAEATVATKYNIKWAGTANVTNTFCQYMTNTTTCSSNTTGTYVGNEIYYDLYSCTSAGYTGTTISNQVVTVNAGCTRISGANVAAPYSDTEKAATINTSTQTVAATATNYHVLVLSIQNKTTVQDYNQGKSFTGALTVSSVTN